MKITTLIENFKGEDSKLYNEHGLSMFIETPECKILFDTGKSGDFVYNAKMLNIDLSKIDYLVLSHAHYDHCNGVKRLLQTYDAKPQLVVSKYFFQNIKKYHLREGYKYIGPNFTKNYIESKNIKINYVDDFMKINKDITVFSNFSRTNNFENLNLAMKVKVDDEYVVDTFKDEIALTIDTQKGLLIILGCSHLGVVNIINSIKQRTNKNIYGIIGGTHLVEASKERIDETINYLNSLDIKLIGTSHCTGDMAVNMIKEGCSNFFVNRTGTQIQI